MDRHRIKLLPFDYVVRYERGVDSPCDYGSRHPPCDNLDMGKIKEWSVEDGTDIFVNQIIEENLPHAITIEEIQKETSDDAVLKKLILLIGKTAKMINANNGDLLPYKQIFYEL